MKKNVEYFNNFVVNDDIVNIINTEEILKLNFASSSVAFKEIVICSSSFTNWSEIGSRSGALAV